VQRSNDRKHLATHCVREQSVLIDSATLLLCAEADRAVINARSVGEAPRGAFWQDFDDRPSASGYATALVGDTRVGVYRLCTAKKRLVAWLVLDERT
jgi:hypothetical protein